MDKLIALLICILLAAPLAAQNSVTPDARRNMDATRKVINDRRNTLIAYNMTFSQQEKEKFWPVYREYREAMMAVGDKRLANIIDYSNHAESMTQAKAKQLLDRAFEIDRETLRVKEKFVRKFRHVLPETKVARLMQIERRMDLQVEAKIAEGVPLME